MHYYIDGYNLLFFLFGITSDDLKSQREWLIKKLNTKIEFLGLNITLVFDSHFCPGEGSRSHFHHLEILYTPQGITADDYIIQKIKNSSDPKKEILVTNDKQLSFRARDLLAGTQTLEHFVNWLDRRYSNKKQLKIKPTIPKALKSSITTSPHPELPPQSPAAGSLEHYLSQFEASYKESLQQKQAVKIAKTEGIPPKRKKKIEQETQTQVNTKLSEFERWLDIFEKKLRNREEGPSG